MIDPRPPIDSFPEEAQAYIRALLWENEKYRVQHAEARAQFEEASTKLTEVCELLDQAGDWVQAQRQELDLD